MMKMRCFDLHSNFRSLVERALSALDEYVSPIRRACPWFVRHRHLLDWTQPPESAPGSDSRCSVMQASAKAIRWLEHSLFNGFLDLGWILKQNGSEKFIKFTMCTLETSISYNKRRNGSRTPFRKNKFKYFSNCCTFCSYFLLVPQRNFWKIPSFPHFGRENFSLPSGSTIGRTTYRVVNFKMQHTNFLFVPSCKCTNSFFICQLM